MSYSILLGVLFVAGLAAGRRLPNIHWNSNSSTFDISTSAHVIEVEIGDQISIVCPEPGPWYEFTQLYMVSKDEYASCDIQATKPKLIGACTDDNRQSTLSIVFRKYSPLPGGLEFMPNNTYYVISTSEGPLTGLDNRVGGLCAEKQMKIKFEVKPDHHHKSARHEDRSVSPKFAARMIDHSADASIPSEFSTEAGARVEYIIHESTEGIGEDDAASSLSLLPTVLLLAMVYLLRQ